MPAEHDYPPPAKTENERLEHKRYQSAHAFEQNHPPVPRSSVHAWLTGSTPKSSTPLSYSSSKDPVHDRCLPPRLLSGGSV